jgi:hypothetical protein
VLNCAMLRRIIVARGSAVDVLGWLEVWLRDLQKTDERREVGHAEECLMRSMFRGSAGRWSGDIWGLNDLIQQVAKRHQVFESNYDAGAHYAPHVHGAA